jgi:multidrug resistance efflux pump
MRNRADRRIGVRRRRGWLAAVPVAVACGVVLCWQAGSPPVAAGEPGQAVPHLSERGNLQSANSVEVRCKVSSHEKPGTMILFLVPEGTRVEPGERIVELDSSFLEDEQARQQIVVAQSEALVIQAQGACETAKIARQEYLEGTYPLESQAIRNEIFVAQQQLQQTEAALEAVEQAAEKGAATGRGLENVRFAHQKAANELELAQMKLAVLEKFTKPRMLRQLEAKIEATVAQLNAQQTNHRFATEKLQRIEEQIRACAVRAPAAGIVSYARVGGSRARGEIVIEEGALVRERQPILRIDDLSRLQLRTTVHESRISLIKEGMPAKIRFDAFPDREVSGTVLKVARLPEPASWLVPDLKQYETIIRIDDPPEGLRVGMTAEVKILLDRNVDDGPVLRKTTRQVQTDRMFQALDRNDDGRLDREELSASARSQLGSVDADGDGAVELSEWRAAVVEWRTKGKAMIGD